MTIFTKFNSRDLAQLKLAANKETFLDVNNPKLYKKVKKYYESMGVAFNNDPDEDYEIIENMLYNDFLNNESKK